LPSTTVTISVSRREADRPRLLQALAVDANGRARPALSFTITVDDNGTFADDDTMPVRERSLRTPADGIVLFQWYEWPRNGPARDFTSIVTVSWKDEGVIVFLEDLFE
jgi:hypothetical protein